MNHDDTTNTTADATQSCQALDSYFNGDLSDAAVAVFRSHLSSCVLCREAVEQQTWIDGLLEASGQLHRELAPRTLIAASTQKISNAHRRKDFRRAITSLAAVAATIAAITTWRIATVPGGPRQAAAPGSARGPSPQALIVNSATPWQSQGLPGHLDEAPRPSATFVANADAIAIPLTSDDAQVSIVQVYPTTTAQRRMRREWSLYAGPMGQDGG